MNALHQKDEVCVLNRAYRDVVPHLLKNRSSIVRDISTAGIALIPVLALMLTAMWTVWFPLWPMSYIWVAVASAAVWPASRLAPRLTLLAISLIASVPWLWTYVASEVRLVPVALAAFRFAQLGGAKRFLIPVIAVATPFVMEHDLWLDIQDGFFLSDLRYGFAWSHPSTSILAASVVAAMIALGYAIYRQTVVAEVLSAKNKELFALRSSERERVDIEIRTALARDIHDVVAHHVAAMVVTAQAADRVADRDPDPERLHATVRTIAAEGDEALAAMRRVVQVLRHGPEDHSEMETFEAALLKLTSRVGASGRRVSVTGEVSGMTEFGQTAALRIVQESLTNVMLHSDAGQIVVSFVTSEETVTLRVEDDGGSKLKQASAHGGNGIRGMRERALAVGGSLSAGPRPGGGWAVVATLPRITSPVFA